MSHIRDYSILSDAGTVISAIRESQIIAKTDPIAKLGVKDVKSEPLSILIISVQEFCERLKAAMSKLSQEKYGGNIKIKLAEDIDQVVESGIDATSIDYVALVCDTTLRDSCLQISHNLQRLGSIVATRLCIVNGAPKDGIEGSAFDVVTLAECNSLLYINGQIREEAGCRRVAERIIHLATTSTGYYTGVPFIYPTAAEIFAQVCDDVSNIDDPHCDL